MKTASHYSLALASAMALGFGGVMATGTRPALDSAAAPRSIAGPEELGKTFSAVVARCSPAVVSIRVRKSGPPAMRSFSGQPFGGMPFGHPHGHRPFGGPPQGDAPPNWGQGSGFVIDPSGVILTNHHVVRDADEILVNLKDGRELTAELLGGDEQSDVAVLRVAAGDLPSLPFADSEALEVGEWVVAIGSPFGLGETVTAGIVSAMGRNQVGIAAHENFIQTDAAINPGNSGGPLINLAGEVVGVNTAIFSRSGGYMGIGFAIPSNLARRITEQLREGGAVNRGYLGVVIQNVTRDLAASFRLDRDTGALVAEVAPDSPASAAGLRAGDVVTAVDGVEITNSGSLRNYVALREPESRAVLTVVRAGEELSVDVRIGSRTSSSAARRSLAAGYGFEVRQDRDRGSDRGLVVGAVEPGSRAAAAGLRPGMSLLAVNRRRVETLQDLEEALASSTADDPLLLRVDAGDGARWIVVK